MNILLVGALSWNPERFISMCERGHKLYGLWTRTMAWEQGPYKFGKDCIIDITLDTYAEKIKNEKIDIIYSLFQVYNPDLWADVKGKDIPDVWTALRRIFSDRSRGLFDIPIVRHWGFDVHNLDTEFVSAFDGHIFCNKEKHISWITSQNSKGFGIDLPYDPHTFMFMDSDLPKQEFMNDNFSKKLSDIDGQIHTVCIGRPLGINYVEAAKRGIHIHIYCNNYDDIASMIARQLSFQNLPALIGTYVHIHPSLQTTVNSTWHEIKALKNRWVSEFSQYDAGWSYVHIKRGDFLEDKAVIPNRLSTYVLAGLPIISEQMPGYYRYDILREHGIQIDLDDYDGLQKGLKDKGFLLNKSESVKSCRNKFSFDYSIDDLIGYFERIRTIYHSRPASEKKRVFTNNSTRYRNLLCRYSRLKTLLFDQTLSILLLPKRKYISSLIQKDVRMKHYK